MKLIYIAGPFRGANAWEVTQNVNRAEYIADGVFQLGAFAVIPHTMTKNFDGTKDDQFWLEGTMALMLRCDAVLAVPPYPREDWSRSEGTKSEVRAARNAGIPVFHDIEDVAEWLEGQNHEAA